MTYDRNHSRRNNRKRSIFLMVLIPIAAFSLFLTNGSAIDLTEPKNKLGMVANDDTQQELLTVNTDRGLDEVYTNNEGVIVSGKVSKQILKDVLNATSHVYYPDMTLYNSRTVTVLADGSYTFRIEMERLELPAGEYRVVVSYDNVQAEAKFIHVIERNQDPGAYADTKDENEVDKRL